MLELIEILLIFVLPVLLIYFGIIKFKHRKITLFIVAVATIVLIFVEKISLKTLGLRFDNFSYTLLPYIIFTILGSAFLFLLFWILRRKPQKNFFSDKKFILFIILGSFIQELLFRGLLFPKLEAVSSNAFFIIIASTILFAFVHIIYSNNFITFSTIFVAGLCFSSMYYLYPNLLLIAISHAILNNIALRYNFYREEGNFSLKRLNIKNKFKRK